MHRSCVTCRILAVVLGLGITEGWAGADDLRLTPTPVPSTGPVLEQPIAPEVPFNPGDAVVPPGPPDGAAKHRSIRQCVSDYLHANIPILCRASRNGLGCGNFVSEFQFLFGSCRTFYGEPCFTRPQPSPVPAGYGFGNGGQAESGKCPCRQD